MNRVLSVVVAVAVLAAAPALASAQSDPFEMWSGFGEGSSVTYEVVSEYGGNKTTSKMKMTLKKKEDDKVTVTMETEAMGKTRSNDQVYEKGKKKECVACKKEHKAMEIKETGKDKVKVGDKEIDVTCIEVTQYGCADKETKSKGCISKDVPGWAVKSEMKGDKYSMTMTCTAFEKK